MKKMFIGLVAFLCLAAGAGGFAYYIHTREYGVDYQGRSRLVYNWKYHFAKCGKYIHPFRGKLFSFEYLSASQHNPVKQYLHPGVGYILFDDHLVDIIWSSTLSERIVSELSSKLNDNAEKGSDISSELMQWALQGVNHPSLNYLDIYNADIRRIELSDDAPALLVSLNSKIPGSPHMEMLLGIAAGGNVFTVKRIRRPNISGDEFLERNFPPLTAPRPEQDAQSDRAFKKILQTFRVLK